MALIESHEQALRDLQPLDLCDQVAGSLVVPAGTPCPCQFCSIRRVDAGYFDDAAERIALIHVSTFSVEEVGDLAAWEAFLDLPFDPALTEQQRWDRVRDRRVSRNGLNKQFFLDLATRMGYSISIVRGVYPFRAGFSKAGDSIKAVNRLTTPDPADPNDIRNQATVVANPYDRSQGSVAITATNPFPSDFWTWIVQIDNLGSNPDSTLLRERFEALKPYNTVIIWMEP
jgi:hypothetical protein